MQSFSQNWEIVEINEWKIQGCFSGQEMLLDTNLDGKGIFPEEIQVI